MNVAYLRPEPGREKAGCGFEDHGPTGEGHCRAFVHGYADVPYHWHREMEILFVLRGRFRLVVDGQVCEMEQDDAIIINADVPHNSTSISRDTLICGVHLDAAHFERLGLPGFASRQYLCRTFLHSQSFMHRVAPIKALMARLALDLSNHPEEIMVRQTIASLLACYVYRWIPHEVADAAGAQLRSDSRDRILRIMDTLSDQDEGQNLGEIAEEEGLTLSHLSRLFKRHLGIGYRDYSQNLRLDSAAEALRTTNDTIGIIMERGGFGNPAVFYNKFRARFGCSPAEFRRGHRSSKPQSVLTTEDAAEVQRLLVAHAAGVGKAAELAVGLAPGGKRQIVLSAPHSAASTAKLFGSTGKE
ncbi:helix-turn-helix domain-containing protein [Mesorhizobium humile]|uniref:AraC family transcriptional regulator n=1 Tax=Mesorhizobium humile TaxID=3072313 RepID=A0ABU4YNI6_9HYPH|nr:MULTISPECIES: AraC family transcriptional regulator [unclassified Mesorhizobium]MDX8463159.1 AraC family transcriptional regulator [Mesorhizobium sp. VK2D]MDX8488532.1 AraC family transcriptional regulator [Mesorhizobium sp. VK2B]